MLIEVSGVFGVHSRLLGVSEVDEDPNNLAAGSNLKHVGPCTASHPISMATK
jgi:hypothetical protein